jgi:hypothetical protein
LLQGTNLRSQTAAVVRGTGSTDPADFKSYNYLISGLSNTTESENLIILFKSRPGIIEIETDILSHSIIVTAASNMPETDVWEILKFAGKSIIADPKEITKFY